jgi:hypothetical protein
VSDGSDPLASTDPLAPGPSSGSGSSTGSGDHPLLEYGERKLASALVGEARDEFNLMPRGSMERLEGTLAMSNLDEQIRGTGSHDFSLTPHIDPSAIEDLFSKHSSSDSEKDEAKSGSASHYLSLEFSNMKWMDFQSKLGSTSILSDATFSLTPDQSGSPLQLGVHADLIKQQWADLGALKLTSDLQGTMSYVDHKGVRASLDLQQDVTFKTLTVEAIISTDLRTGSTTFVGALKFEF